MNRYFICASALSLLMMNAQAADQYPACEGIESSIITTRVNPGQTIEVLVTVRSDLREHTRGALQLFAPSGRGSVVLSEAVSFDHEATNVKIKLHEKVIPNTYQVRLLGSQNRVQCVTVLKGEIEVI